MEKSPTKHGLMDVIIGCHYFLWMIMQYGIALYSSLSVQLKARLTKRLHICSDIVDQTLPAKFQPDYTKKKSLDSNFTSEPSQKVWILGRTWCVCVN